MSNPSRLRPRGASALNGLRGVAAIALLFAPFSARSAGLASSAEYIVGFVRYVHWDHEEDVVAWQVCVGDGVAPQTDRAYAGQMVRGKRFAVRRVTLNDDVSTCHVLDLSGADAASEAALLRKANRLPILTVGHGSNFCSLGGVLCLRLGDPEQKFEINLSAVKESGLNVSARLLMLGSNRFGATEGP
ncbi:MAG TPA: YfiR family protein [Rudaea sp.]|uniref:YfiR family protein n=1 Tax=Rudaea sp. TaxID=2136325 RepID=UPI002F9504F5